MSYTKTAPSLNISEMQSSRYGEPPLEDPQQANHAVKAALGMIESTRDKKIYGHPLRTRIGISSGSCLAGNLGSDLRFDYTVIGDEVNQASRLEGLNKYTGTDIVVSG